MAKQIDWNAIKGAYLKGGIGYRGLAEKFGVSKSAIEYHSKQEKWGDDLRRVQDKVETDLPDKIAAVIVDENATISKDHYDGWELFKRSAKNILALLDDPTKIKDAAAVYRMATEGQRLAKGMDKKEKESIGAKEWADEVNTVNERSTIPTPSEDPKLAE